MSSYSYNTKVAYTDSDPLKLQNNSRTNIYSTLSNRKSWHPNNNNNKVPKKPQKTQKQKQNKKKQNKLQISFIQNTYVHVNKMDKIW